VLALPEDVLTDEAEAPAAPRYQRIAAAPAAERVEQLAAAVARAQRPIVLAGGGGWTAAACGDLHRFAEAWRLPVACAFRFQDVFDNEHPQYAGDVGLGIHPKLAKRIREADVALVLGPRLGEITTGGYSLFEAPVPRQTLVHAHAGAEELGRVYAADVPIHAGMPELAAALAQLAPPSNRRWEAETAAAHAEYLEWSAPVRCPGSLQLAEVVRHLRDRLPPDAIVANDAGNFAGWLHRFYRYRRFKTQLGPSSGAMGYGLPAALAAKSVHPERVVVAFAGDGSFLMTGNELATAMRHDLRIVALVVNNASYGTIRMHQERQYPERVHATDLTNPDFAAYARSFGASGEVVERTEQFAGAFDRALAAGVPAVLELRVPVEAITPSTTITAIRAEAKRRRP
jgi:acetolactate synthase-1/2/3 large subunit